MRREYTEPTGLPGTGGGGGVALIAGASTGDGARPMDATDGARGGTSTGE